MNGSNRPWNQAGGSLLAGMFLGVGAGFLLLISPFFFPVGLLPGDDQILGGTAWLYPTVAVILIGLVGSTLAWRWPEYQRTIVGFAIATPLTFVLLYTYLMWALSSIGS